MNRGDELLRAHSILSTLQRNVPDGHDVEAHWVWQFHATVDRIERAVEVDLSEFRVPGNAIDPKSEYYVGGLWCERALLMQKIDALLAYFSGVQRDEEKRIDFQL